jgi:hypothetical protein
MRKTKKFRTACLGEPNLNSGPPEIEAMLPAPLTFAQERYNHINLFSKFVGLQDLNM